MIVKVSNSGRQNILQNFIDNINSDKDNLYILYSKEVIDRTQDEVPGIITPGTITKATPQLAIRLDNKTQIAIHNTGFDVSSTIDPLVDRVTQGGVDYLVIKEVNSLPEVIKTDSNVTGNYWTTLYYYQSVTSIKQATYNVVTIVNNLKTTGGTVVKDDQITDFSDIDLNNVSILMQALPRDTVLPAGEINLPVIITF